MSTWHAGFFQIFGQQHIEAHTQNEPCMHLSAELHVKWVLKTIVTCDLDLLVISIFQSITILAAVCLFDSLYLSLLTEPDITGWPTATSLCYCTIRK